MTDEGAAGEGAGQDRAPGERSARHDELSRGYIGGPPRHDAPITLIAPDPEWPTLYEREATRIRACVGPAVVRLEHVGSTSVPALAAKPIIDVLLVVADPTDEAVYVGPLEDAGYRLVIREPDWWEHRVLKGPDTNINLHVFGPDSPEIERMLAFRDHLRRDDADRRRYEEAKRALAVRTWAYVQDYADAKGEIVEAIIARALGGGQPALP